MNTNIETLLAALQEVRKSGPSSWTGRCPAHDDKTPSLSITDTDDKILLNCHAGCSVNDVVAASGLTMKDLFPPSKTQQKSRIVATYPYLDADGTVLFEAVRFDPKKFRQRRPDGNGRWVWDLRDVMLVPYRLPQLMAADPKAPVFIPEGEKDVDALVDAGCVATCNPMGAGKWDKIADVARRVLTGRHVIVVADRDEPGRRHARHVAESLVGVAASVAVVEAKVGKDVADHLGAGLTVDDLVPVDGDTSVGSPQGEHDSGLDEHRDAMDALVRGHEAVPAATADARLSTEAWIPAASDATLGEAFADAIAGRYVYVHAWRRWFRWDGKRWAHDETATVHEQARRWVLGLLARADSTQAKRLVRYRDRSRLEAICVIASRIDGIAARTDEFDRDGWLLNCTNGTVDLHTGRLRSHDPNDRITKITGIDYEPGASHPDVDAMLEAVTDDVRAWLQKAFGSTIVGEVIEDLVLVLDGTGANGKSTVLEAVMGALGDYATTAAAKLLMQGGNDEHPTIKADLRGVRFAAISETAEGGFLRAEQVKALSGGDTIKARFMRQDYFEFEPSHSLVLATNHRPRVASNEYALWRRLRLVSFPYRYVKPGDETMGDPRERVGDPYLRQRLRRGQAQQRAVLAWLVAGCVTWHSDGLGRSAEVDDATRAWREAEDMLAGFLAERCVLIPTAEARAAGLYDAFRNYCDDNGAKPWSNKKFALELLGHDECIASGVRKVERRTANFYEGIGLRSEMVL